MSTITETTAGRPLILGGIFPSVIAFFNAVRANRRTLKDLGAMEDHILEDIGLSRVDVVRASVAGFGADRMAMLGHARARRMA